MTDLTEQYQKGELPEGVYYVLYYKNDTAEVDIYRRVYSLYDESEVRFTIPQVTKILAPVPSYEEWQRILHYAVKYECEYTSCVMDFENLKEENDKLKELLKECKGLFNRSTVDGEEPSNGELIMILTKIEQALGEDE